MAAREQARPLRLQELRQVSTAAIERLMEEERARWLALLHWDFAPSSDLIARYIEQQALDGFALVDDGEVVGYTYWVMEDHKGLVGDLYVRDAWRSPANENMLLAAALNHLRRSPWVRRVEAQIMQLAVRGAQVAPGGVKPNQYARHFMLARLDGIEAYRRIELSPGLRLERWSARWLDESAELIASVYEGHVDSEINDQYHSVRGARRFLQNIVQYPGCGQFRPEASLVALDNQGRQRGILLASFVAPHVGHVAQLCLTREYRGSGAGYEMLRQSLAALAQSGATEASLTVTSSNHQAIRLYERFRFRAVYQFEALVWDHLWA